MRDSGNPVLRVVFLRKLLCCCLCRSHHVLVKTLLLLYTCLVADGINFLVMLVHCVFRLAWDRHPFLSATVLTLVQVRLRQTGFLSSVM